MVKRSRRCIVLSSSRTTPRSKINGTMPRRRQLRTLSPETDRAVREACEAAKREIQQRRQRADADMAQKKYGVSARTRVFAARLYAIAMGTFDSTHALTLAPTLVVLQDVKCVSPEQQRQIAHKAALARWKRRNASGA
jgi:hypothetical protein